MRAMDEDSGSTPGAVGRVFSAVTEGDASCHCQLGPRAEESFPEDTDLLAFLGKRISRYI